MCDIKLFKYFDNLNMYNYFTVMCIYILRIIILICAAKESVVKPLRIGKQNVKLVRHHELTCDIPVKSVIHP